VRLHHGRRVARRGQSEELVGGHAKRAGDIREHRAGGLGIVGLVVGDDAPRDAHGLAEGLLRDTASFPDLGARSRRNFQLSPASSHGRNATLDFVRTTLTPRMIMTEILFVAEEAIEGGYIARAVGSSIVTEADDIAGLRDALRDAVRCHFEEPDRPKVIRLHLVHDEVIAA